MRLGLGRGLSIAVVLALAAACGGPEKPRPEATAPALAAKDEEVADKDAEIAKVREALKELAESWIALRDREPGVPRVPMMDRFSAALTAALSGGRSDG